MHLVEINVNFLLFVEILLEKYKKKQDIKGLNGVQIDYFLSFLKNPPLILLKKFCRKFLKKSFFFDDFEMTSIVLFKEFGILLYLVIT